MVRNSACLREIRTPRGCPSVGLGAVGCERGRSAWLKAPAGRAADAPRRTDCYSCCAMRVRSAAPTLARRTFLRAAATAAGSASLTCAAAERRFFTAFVPGSLGIEADQAKSISLASEHGFEAVQPFPSDLVRDGHQPHVDALQQRGLRWAAAGLPVEFRKDDNAFEEGMSALPRVAAVLRQAGADRVGTWLRPSSDDLTYLQNFKRTATRACAWVWSMSAQSGIGPLGGIPPSTRWLARRT